MKNSYRFTILDDRSKNRLIEDLISRIEKLEKEVRELKKGG